MAMVTINGDKRVFKVTNNLRSFLSNPKSALKEVGDFLEDEFDKQFESQGSHLTSKWTQLKASTIDQRLRLGYGAGPIMQRSGKLRRGFKRTLKRFSVRIYNPVDYFKYHQRGDSPQPKRQMIAAPEKTKGEIVEIFRKKLDKSINL